MESVGRFVAEQLAAWEVPGCAVAVVRDGQVELTHGWGLRDREAGLPVTQDTLFAIGSVTKAFTATTIGALVDEITVALRGERTLTVATPGSPPLDLEPISGLRFGVKDRPAVTAEFELDPGGTVARLVAQPLGIFRRKAAA